MENTSAERAGTAAGAAPLELDGISAVYPGRPSPVVSDVNLRVEAGELVALLGANGAGKSTLLRVAAGLLGAAGGAVRIGGRDVRAIPRRALARFVALVPQSEAVPGGYRVREVISMGRAPHQGAWMRERPDDRAAVDDAMRRCDLAPLAERAIETLSGGEYRRVAVARALAQKPRLLLLDEPAAFLDVRHRLALYELLATVASNDGIACVVAMHDLDAAARFATAIVLMRDGRVVARGAPDDAMTAERLSAAFDVEIATGVHATSGEPYFVPLRARALKARGG